jgi:hypothetical protein
MKYDPNMSVAAHIEKVQAMLDARMRREMDVRAHDIAVVATSHPFRMIPLECAVIHNQLSLRLQSLVCRANSDQFDRLTNKGYRLNFVTGEYQTKEETE